MNLNCPALWGSGQDADFLIAALLENSSPASQAVVTAPGTAQSPGGNVRGFLEPVISGQSRGFGSRLCLACRAALGPVATERLAPPGLRLKALGQQGRGFWSGSFERTCVSGRNFKVQPHQGTDWNPTRQRLDLELPGHARVWRAGVKLAFWKHQELLFLAALVGTCHGHLGGWERPCFYKEALPRRCTPISLHCLEVSESPPRLLHWDTAILRSDRRTRLSGGPSLFSEVHQQPDLVTQFRR